MKINKKVKRTPLLFSRFNVALENGSRVGLFNAYSGRHHSIPKEAFDAYTNTAEIAFSVTDILNMKRDNILVLPDESKYELNKLRHEYYNNKYDSKIIMLTIKAVDSCNFRCPQCFQDIKKSGGAALNKKDYESIYAFCSHLLENRNPQGLIIWWYGGEPLLATQAAASFAGQIRGLCESRAVGCYQYAATNGSLLSNPSKQLLVESIDHYYVSLSQSSEQQALHRPYKGGKNSYAEVLSGLKHLSSLGKKIGVRFNISRLGAAAEDLTRTLSDISAAVGDGYPGISFEFHPIERRKNSCITDEVEDETISSKLTSLMGLMPSVIANSPWDRRHFILPVNGENFSIRRRQGATCSMESCAYLRGDQYFIAQDGLMYVCNNLDGLSGYSIGHIQNYKDIFKNQLYLSTVNSSVFDDPICCECPFIPVCLRTCSIKALNNGGEYHSRSCFDTRMESVRRELASMDPPKSR